MSQSHPPYILTRKNNATSIELIALFGGYMGFVTRPCLGERFVQLFVDLPLPFDLIVS